MPQSWKYKKHHSEDSKKKIGKANSVKIKEWWEKYYKEHPERLLRYMFKKPQGFQKGHGIFKGSEKGWFKPKTSIMIDCGVCHKSVKTKRYGTKDNQKFCGRECWRMHHTMNNPMANPKIRLKQLVNVRKSQTEEWRRNNKKWMRPNKIERELTEMMQKKGLPYKYVGNFEVIIGNKNPDYIQTNGKKKLIELFGNYWHKPEEEQKRIDFFKEYGFNTLIIWEKELEDLDKVIEKIKGFDNE